MHVRDVVGQVLLAFSALQHVSSSVRPEAISALSARHWSHIRSIARE